MRLTQARLKELLHYDPATGLFTRLVARNGNTAKAGTRAGSLKAHGYRAINVDGRRYYEHQLAILYMTGTLPDNRVRVDHRDCNVACNKWANLRVATPTQNCQNRKINKTNAHGFKGVFRHVDPKRSKRYGARIKVNYKAIHLGWFQTPEEAHVAYCRAAQEMFGEFAGTA